MKRTKENALKEQILALPAMKRWKETKRNRCHFPIKYLNCSLDLMAFRSGSVVRPSDFPKRRRPEDLESIEYTLDFWPSVPRSKQYADRSFSCRSSIYSFLTYPGNSLASDILLPFKSNFFRSLEWPKARLLWIGQMKNKPAECLFARLPKEIILLILQICGEEKLKFLPENENELQQLLPSKSIYIGWYGDTVDWLDLKEDQGPVWISFNKQHFVSSWLEIFWRQYYELKNSAECERETEEENNRTARQQKEEKGVSRKDSSDEEEYVEDEAAFKEDWLFWQCFD